MSAATHDREGDRAAAKDLDAGFGVDPDGGRDDEADDIPATRRGRRRSGKRAWSPELDDEVSALLRLLAVRPWLVADRDDNEIAAVRRNLTAMRDTFGRLGWVLHADRELVRLRKSPPPRRQAWAAQGPNPLTCAWFFLLTAAAESLQPRVSLSTLVEAARAAAAGAGVPTTGQIDERRAVVAALKLLDERGVLVSLEGDVEGFVQDESTPVLIAVHHNRLAHVIANVGGGDPAHDPQSWLDGVEHEADPARRMRRRLVDDALVHTADLDPDELDWLRRRVRADDGAPLASAFGLVVERRSEGAAFVMPASAYRYPNELGPVPFAVNGGTIPHAALLLCDAAAADGTIAAGGGDLNSGPGPGWRGLAYDDVLDRLSTWANDIGAGRGGWSADLVEQPEVLARRVHDLLTARDLLRTISPDAQDRHGLAPDESPTGPTGRTWWFSPATGRWPAPPAEAARPRTSPRATPSEHTLFDTTEDPMP